MSRKSLNKNINVVPSLSTNDKSDVLRLNDISITYTKQSILDQILNRFSDKNITVKDINIDIKMGAMNVKINPLQFFLK